MRTWISASRTRGSADRRRQAPKGCLQTRIVIYGCEAASPEDVGSNIQCQTVVLECEAPHV